MMTRLNVSIGLDEETDFTVKCEIGSMFDPHDFQFIFSMFAWTYRGGSLTLPCVKFDFSAEEVFYWLKATANSGDMQHIPFDKGKLALSNGRIRFSRKLNLLEIWEKY